MKPCIWVILYKRGCRLLTSSFFVSQTNNLLLPLPTRLRIGSQTTNVFI